MKTVLVNGVKKQDITFDEGSKITVAPGSDDVKKYHVGVVKDGTDVTASVPMTTSVPAPSIPSHPSLSTAGSVPPMAVPESTSGGSNNLPGIVAGVVVLGLAGGRHRVRGHAPALMSDVSRRRRRLLHPLAWWVWAVSLALCVASTTHPLLLLMVIAVLVFTVLARRPLAAWSRSLRLYLGLGAFVIA